jgi:hypothetical protein
VALLSLVSSFACFKPSTNVALADANHQTADSRATPTQQEADAGRRPHLERMYITASVSGLGEMLDAGEQIYAQWVPPEPGAPPLDFQSFIDLELVQLGLGPAWFANIDLDGLHTAAFGVPHEGQAGVSMADYELAASLASRNPSMLINALPPEPAPEQLEPNLWQIEGEDHLRLLLRTRSDTLEIATSLAQLDSLDGTRQALRPGRGEPRVRLSASHLDEDVVELGPILAKRGITPDKQQAILDALELDFRADFGSDRDLMMYMAWVAPFEDTFIDGPILTGTSSLAKLLPTGALMVLTQSWEQPLTLAELRKQLATREPPSPPVALLLEELLSHADDLLAQFGSESTLAVYVDDKGRATFVLLTSIADESATKAAVRELFAAVERASPSFPGFMRTKLRRDAPWVGKHKSDVLSIELPDDLRYTLDGMPWLLGTGQKPTLELSGTVGAGKLVIAIGPGQRELLGALVTRLSGSTDEGLERGGLARARELTGGCQTCIAIDPVATAHGLLAILAASPDADQAFRKLLDTARKRLRGLGLAGEISIAGRHDAQRWEFALNVPKTLLFLGPNVAPRILESIEAVRDGYSRIGVTNEALCKHAIDAMQREWGQAMSADELERFRETCPNELDKEREKIGNTKFRKRAKCVLEMDKLDDMKKCDQL